MAIIPWQTLFRVDMNGGVLFNAVLLVLVIRHSGPVYIANSDKVTVQPCSTWNTAISTCRSSGPSRWLAIILNNNDHKFVSDQMTSHNISTMWFGLRRQRFDKFIWLDCRPAPADFARQLWPDFMNCAFFNRRQNALDANKCSTKKGVICEIKDCSKCVAIECTRIAGRCFYKTCTPMTWEAGRAHCRSFGWDLAVLGSEEEGRLIQMSMVSRWTNSSCRFYWIGLRREEWVYPNTPFYDLSRLYWGDGEPGLTGDCAVMTKTGGRYTWRAARCTDRHPAFCYRRPVNRAVEGPIHTTLQSCRPWKTALATCDSALEDLPVIKNKEDYGSICKIMDRYKLNSTWLALTRHRLEDFLWLDCKPAPTNFKPQKSNATSNCAYLNSLHSSLDTDSCSSVKGVVCEIKGCLDCSVNECTLIEGRCFYKTCTPMAWEASRAFCRSRDWDLAVFGSTDQGELIRQTLATTWKDSSCTAFWIGLRREEWVYPNNAHLRITQVYWEHDEPREHGQCSIMIRTTHSYRWRMADCNERHPAVCIRADIDGMTSQISQTPFTVSKTNPWVDRSTKYSSTKSTVAKIKQVTHSGTYYGLLCGLIFAMILLLMIFFLSVYLICQNKYMKKVLKAGHDVMTRAASQRSTERAETTNPQALNYRFYTEELRRDLLESERRRRESHDVTQSLINDNTGPQISLAVEDNTSGSR